MSQNTVTLCWYPPAKTYLPSPAMTVLKKSLQEVGIDVQIVYWNILLEDILLRYFFNEKKSLDDDIASLGIFFAYIAIERNDTEALIKQELYLRALKPQYAINNFDFQKHIRDCVHDLKSVVSKICIDYNIKNSLFVGMSMSLFQWIPAYVVGSILKELNPNLFITVGGIGNPEEDATRFVHPSLNTATPIMLQEQGLKIISENEFMSLGGIESYNKQDSTKHLSLINSYNLFGDGIFGIKNLGIHVISSGNTYVNLLKNKSAAIILNYQNDNFCIKTGVIANQYATRGITTQLGINGFLEYKISRHWSLAVYGTIYDFNPYFSMATFPFIETTSYGGWIKYEGEKMGVKLGARRYYDAFQKQWKMEPIITPSIKIGKKMYFELPVGPLVQRSMEKLLKRQTNNSPVITPNLK